MKVLFCERTPITGYTCFALKDGYADGKSKASPWWDIKDESKRQANMMGNDWT